MADIGAAERTNGQVSWSLEGWLWVAWGQLPQSEHRANAALSLNVLLRRKAGAQPLDVCSVAEQMAPSDSAGPEVCSASAACLALLVVT